MSLTSIKKYSVVVGLLSFTLIFFGSLLYGARIFSSFVRGVEGFAIFGLLAWLILRGWLALNSEEDKDKGVNLDQTV
ncbi:MAG: hypothetical protein OEZ27_03295 [Nitrospinota bacterium]|jgi:hypothetical protein|nr:hypothetical protein [Nitrospinota bacterium]